MRFRSVVLVVASVFTVAGSAGCSNQGEGDFCSSNNGSADCQSGLTCVSAPGLQNSGLVDTDRCCPPAEQATVAVCMANASGVDTSNPVGDAFPEGDDASDAMGDAPHDAPSSDASSDRAVMTAVDASDGAPD